jgi:hypothetical protein
MTYKVKFTHSNKSHAHITSAELREGEEIYKHPEGYFVVLEFQGFQGESGKFREAFWPEEVVKQELFL